MKKILLAIFGTAFIFSVSSAQILNKVKDKIKQASDVKSSTPANSGNTQENPQQTGVTTEETTEASNNNNLTYTSKYDFVSGEKVMAYEDFNHTAIGDFPTRWNTNGSAEIVTLNKKEGKWFRINNGGIFFPEFINSLPENSTLEFDLGVNTNFHWGSGYFQFYITHLENRDAFANGEYMHQLNFKFHPSTGENNKGGVSFSTEYGKTSMHNDATAKNWDNQNNLFAHVSLWRQGQRLRMYVNGDKLFDLPKAFEAGGKYTAVLFKTDHFYDGSDDGYLLGNIRLAVGAPDTRNKLITEGKFVTSGIYFDVASDKLKPDSYGVLKEIATVLKENEGVKIKIVGHTDSDGDDAKNLELSKKRAASVKKALETTYGIAASRIETDGKGETAPITKNDTQEGKAQNRRVEFIKL